MSSFASSVLLALVAASATSAHMQMSKPYPYNSALNPDAPWDKKDYSMTSPLVSDGVYPCKGFIGTADQGTRESWTAGETVSLTFAGSAVHGGGSCQFSLSYDNGTNFHVIESYIGGCMSDSSSFDVQIPSTVPAGNGVVFSWSWFNKVGNREMYQNCLAVDISSSSTTALTTPTIFVANAGVNTCSTVENTPVVFPSPGDVVIYGGEYAGKSIGNGLTASAGAVGTSCFAPGSIGAGSGSSSGSTTSAAAVVSSAASSSTIKSVVASSSVQAASSYIAPSSSIKSSSVASIPTSSSAAGIPSSSAYVAPSSSSKAYVSPSSLSQIYIASSSPIASAKTSLPNVAAHASYSASSSAAAPASSFKSSGFASVVVQPTSSKAVASPASSSKAATPVTVILPSSASPSAVLVTSTIDLKTAVAASSAAAVSASGTASSSASAAVSTNAAGQACSGDAWTCDGQILNRCSYGSWVTIADCAAQSGVVCSASTPIGCVWPWQAATAKKRDFSSSRHTARGHGNGAHGKGPSRKRLVPNHHSRQLDNAGVAE